MRAPTLPLLLAACAPAAPWVGRDVRLDAPPEDDASDARHPVACRSGAFRYVVWEDGRWGGGDLVVRASLDRGRTWEPEVRLTDDRPDGAAARAPALACDQGRAVAAWEDTRASDFGRATIRLAASRDGGRAWTPSAEATANTAGAWDSLEPAVAVRGERVHLVWSDGRDGALDVRHRTSADLGRTWAAESRLDQDPPGRGWSGHPALAVDALGGVLVVWEDARAGGADVHAAASLADGLPGTWLLLDHRLDADEQPGASDAFSPSPALHEGEARVVWHDLADGTARLRSVGGPLEGLADAFPQPAIPSADAQRFGRTFFVGGLPHVAWFEGDDDVAVYVAVEGEAPVRLSPPGAKATWPLALDVDGLAAALTWSDLEASGREAPREDVWVAASDGATWFPAWRADDDDAGRARSAYPSVMVDEALGLVDVVWEEWRYGDADVYRRPARLAGPEEAP